MEPQTLQFFEIMGWAGVVGVFVWKVLGPLTKAYIRKMNGNSMFAKLEKIEGNDLHSISEAIHTSNETLKRIERKMDKLDEIENMLVYLKARSNGRG